MHLDRDWQTCGCLCVGQRDRYKAASLAQSDREGAPKLSRMSNGFCVQETQIVDSGATRTRNFCSLVHFFLCYVRLGRLLCGSHPLYVSPCDLLIGWNEQGEGGQTRLLPKG